MKRAYMQLHDLNKEIFRGYEIRRNNHLELLECLRIVNQAVQKASRLRGRHTLFYVVSYSRKERHDNENVATCMLQNLPRFSFTASVCIGGKAKTVCTKSCRMAIRQSDQDALIPAIELGTV